MGYRAASTFAAQGVFVLAADVPPDVAQTGATLPPVLIGRGSRDDWYTAEKLEADLRTLRQLGVAVDTSVFDGGHEWSAEFRAAVSTFLAGLASRNGRR